MTAPELEQLMLLAQAGGLKVTGLFVSERRGPRHLKIDVQFLSFCFYALLLGGNTQRTDQPWLNDGETMSARHLSSAKH